MTLSFLCEAYPLCHRLPCILPLISSVHLLIFFILLWLFPFTPISLPFSLCVYPCFSLTLTYSISHSPSLSLSPYLILYLLLYLYLSNTHTLSIFLSHTLSFLLTLQLSPCCLLLLLLSGEWDFVYNDRKNRWLSELGMEDVKPRKRRSPGGDSIDYEKY